MNIFVRFALAFTLSYAAAAVAQQAILHIFEGHAIAETLVPLVFVVLAVSGLYGFVVSWRHTAKAVNRTSASLLAFALVFGTFVYCLGVSSISPGMGGKIGYGVAVVVVFYFMVPAALAVPVHWLLLRRPVPAEQKTEVA